MKLPPYPKDGARLAIVSADAHPPFLDQEPFAARLDLVADLPCVEIEWAIAHGLPVPHMPAAIPGIAELKSKRRKASYYARRSNDDVFRESERGRAKQCYDANPEKARAKKLKAREENYIRPFVAIDSEGQSYPGDDILYDGVRYAKHATYLWGAAADDRRPPLWLMSDDTRGADKKPLGAIEILDWLLDLPRQFGKAVFVMFSFSYDVTQILKDLPYETAYEIEKRETQPDANGSRRSIGHSPVFWKDYAISYFKGKSLAISRLANHNRPYRPHPKTGKMQLDVSERIRIYDVFGFFQSSFSAVTDSMVKTGRATKDEADFMRVMKAKRGDFASVDIGEIKPYTSLELRLLARMMADLREGYDKLELRLRDWHGAGAASSALIQRERLKEHYGHDAGEWAERRGEEIPRGSLRELRNAIEAASIVSMFKIRYRFPEYEKYHSNARKADYIPFYPLPYREKGGGILFPACGYGWYMRDDALAAIAWLERFVPDFPKSRKRDHKGVQFDIEQAWLFEPRNGISPRPFQCIPDLFHERRRIKEQSERAGAYDIREKAIKLALNSMYGKLAQSVGSEGKPPPTANPYYAAATTANTRRRLMEAALIDPHSVVFFATDGIVTTRPLNGLPRLRMPGEHIDLGDWEYCEADGGIFVQPGVYMYGKVGRDEKTGARIIKPVSKLRGGDPKKYAAQMAASEWIVESVLAAWRKPFDPKNAETSPRIVAGYQKFITAGNALASIQRWKLAGRWTPQPDQLDAARREIFVHGVGNKRYLIPNEECWPDYVSSAIREANRCNRLVRTLPTFNKDDALSRPRMPDWINEELGEEFWERDEQDAIRAGFE